MGPRAVRRRNALPAIARTACVATVGVWEHAKRVRRRGRTKASMVFADLSRTTRIRTKNAGVELATVLAFASNTTAFLVRINRSVCPIIASTVSAAATCARRCVTRVRKQKKARDSMESAGLSCRAEIWKANAIRVNVTGLVVAISRKTRKPTARSAYLAANVPPAIASMACVATRLAPRTVWPAPRRKKAAALTACVGTSVPNAIRTSNAMVASAMAKAFVVITTAHLVPLPVNVSPTIASMDSVAETSARALAKRVRRPKKAADSTAYVETSPMRPTPTMNAIRANATAPGPAINRNLSSPMARPARSPRNAYRAIVSTAFAAIPLARAPALPVPRPRKAKAPTARAASSSPTPILTMSA